MSGSITENRTDVKALFQTASLAESSGDNSHFTTVAKRAFEFLKRIESNESLREIFRFRSFITLSLRAFLLKKALQLSQVTALKLYPRALSPHTEQTLLFLGLVVSSGLLPAGRSDSASASCLIVFSIPPDAGNEFDRGSCVYNVSTLLLPS